MSQRTAEYQGAEIRVTLDPELLKAIDISWTSMPNSTETR